MKASRILITLGLLGFLALIISISYIGLTEQTISEKTKCYDKYSHEIVGQECIKQTFSQEEDIIFLTLTSAILFFGGMGIRIWEDW